MRDLEKALAEIGEIKSQLAQGTMFRGFGPAVMAATAAMAATVALMQTLWPSRFAANSEVYLLVWILTAIACAALIGVEMIARSKRLHGGLADIMLINAVENFLPAGLAGAVIGAVLYTMAPANLWMLPGLWQVLVALGIFAAARTLPRTIYFVGAWYFLAGVTVLMICADQFANATNPGQLNPWVMGLPFAVGQALTAYFLKVATEPDRGDRHGKV